MIIKKLNRHVWLIGLLALSGALVAGSMRCGKSSTNSNNSTPTTQALTISGVLEQGSVIMTATTYTGVKLIKTANASLLDASLSGLSITPLTGYQLYCITFSNPPAASSGTADTSGNVAVTLNATNTPFGCFVLDSSGKGVGTLIFTNTTNGQNSQTAVFSSNANLGTIMVDLTDGLALAELPSGGSLVATTPSGTPCPVGTWIMGTPSTTCTSEHVDFWIAKSSSGQYLFSYTHYGCYGSDSQSNLPMTYSGGVITAAFNPSVGNSSESYCSSQLMTITFTPDTACTTMSGSFVVSGVTQCGTHFGGCGSMACPAVSGLTGTKQ